MKIIDKFILKSYTTKFISFFILLMFVFIFQTVWMFIDDLAGKEIDLSVVFKFLIFYCPKLLVLVIPLTVLLSSIMVYGELSENYELAAIKSSGKSLLESTKFIFVFNLMLTVLMFFVCNNLIPLAEFKSYNLRKNLAKVKPSLAVSEGLFNRIGNINIKVDKKYGNDNAKLENVLIHKISQNNENNIVIKSKSGKLITDEVENFLRITLEDGYRYEEIKSNKNNINKPSTKIFFDNHTLYIDLRKIYDVDFSDEKYSNTFRMQNFKQLGQSVDSLSDKFEKDYSSFSKNFYDRTGISNFQNNYKKNSSSVELRLNENINIINNYDYATQQSILAAIENNISNQKNNLKSQKAAFFIKKKLINLHKVSYHDKYAIPFSIIVLLILGIPLGSLIRKGGFGLPVVIALLFFLSFHFIGTFARNAAEDGSLSPILGSWLSNLIFFPLGLYLIVQASSDKDVLNIDDKLKDFKKIISK